MDNNKNYMKPNDIWDAEAKVSFVKATTDWFSISKYSSRLHLSFVSHDGQKPKPKQLDAIEIGIPMVKAGSDGNGETGVTALSLANSITTGALAKKAMMARQAAQQAGKKYADDIYVCIGGTPASRAKNGVAEFRRFSIAPGAKDGTYALKAARCEGEDSATGGVQPKKGAQWSTIILPVSESYMRTLGENIKAEWTAFLTAKRLLQASGTVDPQVQPQPQPQQVPVAPVMAEPEPPAIEESKLVYMIYDLSATFNKGLPVVTDSGEKAIEIIKDVVRQLLQSKKRYVANPETYNKAVELCNGDQKGSGSITFVSKLDKNDVSGVGVVCDFIQ